MWLLPKHTPEYETQLKEADKRYKKKGFEPKDAVTNYRVLDKASEAALVLCQPETGKDVTNHRVLDKASEASLRLCCVNQKQVKRCVNQK